MMRLKIGMLIGLIYLLTACQQAEGVAIEVQDAWGRPSPAEATNGAFFMTIENSGSQADKLLGATSSACGVIELHETTMGEGDSMGMRPVPDGYIEIPANSKVELKPGGLHVMCIDKQADFSVGAKLPLSLQFETTGEIELEVEVRNP
jgi:hypothetical protein